MDSVRKICGRCGQAFACQQHSVEGCHCSLYNLRPELSKALAEKYTDCLCGECLAELTQNDTLNDNNDDQAISSGMA